MPPTPVVISQSSEPEIDKSLPKIIILAIFGIGLSVLSTYFFSEFLVDASLNNFFGWFFSIIGFFVFVILEAFFVKSSSKIFCIMFLQGVAPLSIFWNNLYPEPLISLLVGGFIYAMFLMISASRGLSILRNSVSIKFFFVSRNMLPKMITGALIFMSIITYASYFELGRFTDQLGRSIVYETLNSSEPIIKMWFPAASFNDKTNDFFRHIAEAQLNKVKISLQNDQVIDFSKLPESVKERLIQENGDKISKSLQQTFVAISPEITMKDAIYRSIKQYVDDFSVKTKALFGIIVAVALYFTFKGIFSLLHWLIGLIAFVFYKFLIITGFAYLNIESTSREFTLLS